MKKIIPIIDLFAGTGALSEGFILNNNKKILFKKILSIESDKKAFKTLLIRSIFHKLNKKSIHNYYDFIKEKITFNEFLKKIPDEILNEANSEVLNIELSSENHQFVDVMIEKKLKNKKEWILLGGPPCQAYSIAGRSKLVNTNYSKYLNDHRHYLYKEYLRIIKKFKPTFFIMENVKGILSSRLNNDLTFNLIRQDLESPSRNLKYKLSSFSNHDIKKNSDFIIKSEDYEIPQKRHRIFIFGIREDIRIKRTSILKKKKHISVYETINDLPVIRSNISKEVNSHKNWIKITKNLEEDLKKNNLILEKNILNKITKKITNNYFDSEKYFYSYKNIIDIKNKKWFVDPNLNGYIQHKSRSHIAEDIKRYIFFAISAELNKKNLTLVELPPFLNPKHKNLERSFVPFLDRFKVQMRDKPSSTIFAHISKDGHYFIHYDPSQGRSLTVREAARLQTFPDNFYFYGGQGASFKQIGNAVPPLLSYKISNIILDYLI